MKKKKDKRTMLEKEIARLEETMSKISDQTSDAYAENMAALERLYAIQNRVTEVKNEGKLKLNPNTLLTVIGSAAEVVLIMNHERLYVIATKALSRVVRARI